MQRSALCRSRRELSNAYLLAKIGVDTAENEPREVWGENSIQYSLHSLEVTPPRRLRPGTPRKAARLQATPRRRSRPGTPRRAARLEDIAYVGINLRLITQNEWLINSHFQKTAAEIFKKLKICINIQIIDLISWFSDWFVQNSEGYRKKLAKSERILQHLRKCWKFPPLAKIVQEEDTKHSSILEMTIE